MAQLYINSNTSKNPLPAWRVNQIGYLLFKAEEMDPTDWAIKMNVACFFAMVGQWPVCMQKTVESLNLVKPLGGLQQPVQVLDQLVKNVTQILDIQKKQVRDNLIPTLEQNIQFLITTIEEQKNPALDPILDNLKDAMKTVEVKRPELGFNMCMDISSELNQLIGMIEKGKIISDPDLIQIKVNVEEMLKRRKAAIAALVQQPAEAISSPAQPALAEKVGETNG